MKGRPEKASDATRLSDLSISHDQSSKWQQLAGVPDDEFEAALAGPEKPTTTGIIEAAKPKSATQPMDKRALWLWDRLRDFERDTPLDDNPLRPSSAARRSGASA